MLDIFRKIEEKRKQMDQEMMLAGYFLSAFAVIALGGFFIMAEVKTTQIRSTLDLRVKAVLEEEAGRMGLDFSTYVRIVLGEKAKALQEKKKQVEGY